MPDIQVPQPVATGGDNLVNKIGYSDLSRTAAEGGRGAVGKTDVYDPTGTINSRGRPHMGVDIGTSGQRGWYCALKLNGKVSYNGSTGNGGWALFILSGGKEYVFMHLARQSKLKVGQTYSAGTPIGEIGNTGRSSSEHLHFEVRVNNKHIDPMPYLKFVEIGKLRKSTQISSGTNLNGSQSIAKADRMANLDAISSKTTGGTQKETNIITLTQKEIIMVG